MFKVIQVAFFSLLMWFLVFFTVGAMAVPWFGVVAVVGVWEFGMYCVQRSSLLPV
jgi:hypothetical protein